MRSGSRLGNVIESLRSTFWFVPSVMLCFTVLIVAICTSLDSHFGSEILSRYGFLYSGKAEGVRTLLSTLAASLVTVTGVSFSGLIVALTMAARQFGYRVLYSFVRDTGNQLVLGTLLSSTVYCLIASRLVREGNSHEFVPHLTVSVAMLYALMSVAILVYFIHHIASSIQADMIIARVFRDLETFVDRHFPSRPASGEDPAISTAMESLLPSGSSTEIFSRKSGYIQSIDLRRLLETAVRYEGLIEIVHRPGHYVTRDELLARVSFTQSGPPVANVEREIRSTFMLGPRRTPEQDIEFSIDQMVEIAVRASSPGVNDAFIAMTCIDRLATALGRIAPRAMPPSAMYDSNGRLRLIISMFTFGGLVDEAFNQIRQQGIRMPATMIRLLEGMGTVASLVVTAEQRDVLRRHALMAYRAAIGSATEEYDRQTLTQRYEQVLRLLSAANQ